MGVWDLFLSTYPISVRIQEHKGILFISISYKSRSLSMLYKSATLSFNGSISSSLIAKRFFRLGLNRPSTYVETEFDKKWKKLSSEEQDALAKDFLPLQSQDWKTLTMEQKKNLYTIAFGVPEIRDPNEKWKVFAGTLAAIGVGLGAFYIVRLFGKIIILFKYETSLLI